ncbi:putative alpha/Beta hydrolase [Rosa chinensis]|uniref:Putative alpha/Beta hydrolase n=1 Tax=Rosa chinensis TaxID=74649 RepID=A0A2P6PYZ7_ROSCH|nr:transmembrane and coiled-coil domain-containing protein 4 [Rosa chinensis]PRQ27139.1 putative alpha/Beta hydrolase [Rosa chinensis]
MKIYRFAKLKPLLALPNSNLLRFRCSVSIKPEAAPVMEAKVVLTQTQRYAAGALFALALHQTQIHQTQPFNALLPLEEETIGDGAGAGRTISVSDDPGIWIHESSGLLYPVLRFLGVEDKSWKGLKETAGSSSQVRHHVGAFLTLLKEGADEVASAEKTEKEVALTKTVDTMVRSEESADAHAVDRSENYEYEAKCREKFSNTETEIASEVSDKAYEAPKRTVSVISTEIKDPNESKRLEVPVEEGTRLSYEKKITVLYAILSACVADNSESGDKVRNGYDARHRVALRLLATWLGVEWLKVEVMETMVACSFMASLKEVANKEKTEGVDGEKKQNDDTSVEKWKRGGLIGAAALTGGTLMAITGGLAAPAIAQGLSALAPVLGGIVPAIGATGFAAAATATGSVTGSLAVAASFGAAGAGLTGTKMARRIGNIEEFEFKAVEGTYNQGRLAVGIVVSGLVFEDEDFMRPWEGYNDHLERYALWWESKNLVALSTAIQDWLTSRIALELMKEGAMLTVLNTLVAAFAMPATLVTASDLIDSKWAIAVDRSDKAGKMLAEVLLKGLQGNRPVTLIGFSLGGRVIFKCLECLAESEGNNAGLVERVVLLGAPVSIEDENWEDARKMVAGRFVNAFSTNDWTLGVAFRASLLSQGLAGIQAVNVPGIENVDVTQFVEGHSSYLWKTKQILELLELESYYPVFRKENTEDKTPQEQNSSAGT